MTTLILFPGHINNGRIGYDDYTNNKFMNTCNTKSWYTNAESVTMIQIYGTY